MHRPLRAAILLLTAGWKRREHTDAPHSLSLLRVCRNRPSRRAAEQRDEFAASHVWMAPAWQEVTSRAAQKSLALMCPACSRSRDHRSLKRFGVLQWYICVAGRGFGRAAKPRKG